jgi:hypothetical protein
VLPGRTSVSPIASCVKLPLLPPCRANTNQIATLLLDHNLHCILTRPQSSTPLLVPLSNPNRNSLQLALSRAAPRPRFLFPGSINQTLRDRGRDREASKQPRTNKRRIGGAYIPDETTAAAACKTRKKEGVKVGEEPRHERWRKARWRGARWRAMKLTRGRSRQAPGAMDVVSWDTRAQKGRRGHSAARMPQLYLLQPCNSGRRR